MPERPFFSVIVPVLDGGAAFRRSLAALAASRFRDYELIVVDDGSTDGSAEAAAAGGARVLGTPGRRGPAAARNLGARAAAGRWLFFLDADCEPSPRTLERARAEIDARPDLDALFGSYDDDPAAPGVVARYKNLLHHWVHHRGAGEAVTFWAGCGAVRRDAFFAVGGFDEERYRRPSIEDVELGYRLVAAGRRIRLVPEVQVKHHKAWTLRGLVMTDVRDRALPWTRLSLERGHLVNRLNLDARSRWSGAASVVLVGALPAAAATPWALLATAGAGGFLLGANLGLYRFFAARGGRGFAVACVSLHWLYFLYSTAALGWGTAGHGLRRLLSRRRKAARSGKADGWSSPR